MTNTIRNSFIINHTFHKFFLASILASVIRLLNTLFDGIIVSQSVSTDAISAITMSMPILSLTILITSMVSGGASMIMAGEIGNQNYKQVNRLFSMSLYSIFIINLLLTIVFYLCTDIISNLLTSDEQLLILLNSYLPISFIGNFFFSILIFLTQFVRITGRPGLVTKGMIVQVFGNITFDLLFVTVFDMGMQGAALASVISFLTAISVFIPYLYSENKPFRLVSLRGGWYSALFGKSLLRGVPIAIKTVMMALLIMGLNAIVLNSRGSDEMFILSVCLQMMTLNTLVSGGASDAITSIGGVLLGEQDYEGAHLLVTKTFKIICTGIITIMVIVIAFPSLIAHIFGAYGDLIQMSEEPLRIFSFIFIPIGLVVPLSNLFMILNRNTMSVMLNIGMVLFVLPIVWLASVFAPEYLWYSMPTGMWLLLFTTVLSTWLISRRTKGLHWFYLTQMYSHRHWITYSVKYEIDDVEIKLNELLNLIECYKLPRKLHLNIHHCLEELMYNEVEMARITKKNGTFDISVNNQEDKISVIIKDVGKPYNPIIKYIPNYMDDVDMSQLSMVLVNSLCENINYKYMNGVNCLYLNFEKQTK